MSDINNTKELPWCKRPENQSRIKERAKKSYKAWYDKNKYWYNLIARERSRVWRKNNIYSERNKELYRKSYKRKLSTDLLFATKEKLRAVVYNAFYRIKKNKPADTMSLIGCSWEEAKAHIESLFQEGMTWENHGKNGWHIDHIKPINTFKEDELYLMNHISNLRPLWAKDNLSRPKDGSDTLME